MKPRSMMVQIFIALAIFLLVKAATNNWWRALLSLAYGSGLRRNEILHLTWADIDFEKHFLRVAAKRASTDVLGWEPKDYQTRVPPMPMQTVQLLVDLQSVCSEGCPYVFIPEKRWKYILHARLNGKWSDEQALVNNLGRGFHTLRRKANVSNFLLHDSLRHWHDFFTAQNITAIKPQYTAGHKRCISYDK